MAKHVFNLLIKITLFFSVMFVVAKMIHCFNFIEKITNNYVRYDTAIKLNILFTGEPSPEPYDSLKFEISVLLNIVLSVPIFSGIIIFFKKIRTKEKQKSYLKEWGSSSVKRWIKLLTLIFLFLFLLQTLPYEAILPISKIYSTSTLLTIAFLNLLITIILYFIVIKRFLTKRSL